MPSSLLILIMVTLEIQTVLESMRILSLKCRLHVYSIVIIPDCVHVHVCVYV